MLQGRLSMYVAQFVYYEVRAHLSWSAPPISASKYTDKGMSMSSSDSESLLGGACLHNFLLAVIEIFRSFSDATRLLRRKIVGCSNKEIFVCDSDQND